MGLSARLLTVASVGAVVYILLLIALPVLEPEFSLLRSHPEDYATGAFGALVNVSYAALALALGLLIAGLVRSSGWNAIALALLVPPAVLCATLAVDPIGVARHVTVVSLAILGLAVGPLAVSITCRRRFGRAAPVVIAGSVLVAVSFAALVAAPESVGGTVNRLFDVLAGAWVALAALSARSDQAG